MKRVGLVLSGGGGRCLAHIGVLAVLEEQGIEIDALTGTSTGALVAALVAAGHSATTIATVFGDKTILAYFSFSKDGGIFDQDRIARVLEPYLPQTFAELHLPFACCATDIQTGEAVTFSQGELLPALLASNAFPGLFDPVKHQGRWLSDGGILNNLPNDLIAPLTTCPVIAVDVSASKDEDIELSSAGSNPVMRVLEGIKHTFTNPVDVPRKAFTIAQAYIIEQRLAAAPPALLIKPSFPTGYSIFTFDRLEEAQQAGRAAAEQGLAL